MVSPYDNTKGQLTAKQKLFCEEYVANGYNATRAYMRAFGHDYAVNSPEYITDAGSASKLLKQEKINKYIDEIQHQRFVELHINADRIATELSTLAFGMVGEDCSENGKLKAIELLSKQLGLGTIKIDAAVNSSITFIDDLD